MNPRLMKDVIVLATATVYPPMTPGEHSLNASIANPPMIKTTKNYNQAAYFLTMGGELVEMKGHYPHITYRIRITPWLAFYEKNVGLCNYKELCNARIELKKQGRAMSGYSPNFTGGDAGFSFADIAHFGNQKTLEKWTSTRMRHQRQNPWSDRESAGIRSRS